MMQEACFSSGGAVDVPLAAGDAIAHFSPRHSDLVGPVGTVKTTADTDEIGFALREISSAREIVNPADSDNRHGDDLFTSSAAQTLKPRSNHRWHSVA